jgi:hypothetical protein
MIRIMEIILIAAIITIFLCFLYGYASTPRQTLGLHIVPHMDSLE